MMGVKGYRTKKDLKSAIGQRLRYVETSAFGPEYPPSGTGNVIVVGPCAYTKRSWYATVTLKDGIITAVK